MTPDLQVFIGSPQKIGSTFCKQLFFSILHLAIPSHSPLKCLPLWTEAQNDSLSFYVDQTWIDLGNTVLEKKWPFSWFWKQLFLFFPSPHPLSLASTCVLSQTICRACSFLKMCISFLFWLLDGHRKTSSIQFTLLGGYHQQNQIMSSVITQSSCYPPDPREGLLTFFWVMDPFGNLMKTIEPLLWKRHKSKNMSTLKSNCRQSMGAQRPFILCPEP